ncbi:MAG: PAS domain-containing protein [Desulfurivibrio sp.]|nr:PAS domain-containing protein [Desulfurivibrio sp.]
MPSKMATPWTAPLPRQLEYRFRHQNGSYRWLRDDYHFVRRLDSTVAGCGRRSHVTDQREDHRSLDVAALLAGRRTIHSTHTCDNIPQQIFWKDRDSVFRGCNLAAARALGLTRPAEIEGKTDHDLICRTKNKRRTYWQRLDEGAMDDGEPQYHVNVR